MIEPFSQWRRLANRRPGKEECIDSQPRDLVSLSPDLKHEFETRLAESARLAFKVAYAVLRHREDAEDVAQEAIAKAYAQFQTLSNRDRFRAWLVRITWRMALDRRRRDTRRLRREESMELSGSTRASITADLQAHIWRALDDLPERLRSVVILRALRGHDVREVAVLLEVAEGTVKSRLHEARKILAEKLR